MTKNSKSWWIRLIEWIKKRPTVAKDNLQRQRNLDEEERRRRDD
jgi:hypothetical protein